MLGYLRKRVVFIIFVLLLVIAGITLYTYLNKQNVKKANIHKPTQSDLLKQKYVNESIANQITDKNTEEITLMLGQKKYAEIILRAKPLCPKLTGNDQAICYNTYAQALMGVNDLKTLVTLSEEALKTEPVSSNENYKTSWLNILKKAKAGINPNTPNKEESLEARQ